MEAPHTATRWLQFYGPLLCAFLGNAAAIQGAALTNREAYHVVSALSILLIVLFARTVNMQHAVSPRRRIAALLTLLILLPSLLAGTANVMRALRPFLPILQPSAPTAPSPTDPFIPVPFRQQKRRPSSVRLHLAVPGPRASIVAEPPGIDPRVYPTLNGRTSYGHANRAPVGIRIAHSPPPGTPT